MRVILEMTQNFWNAYVEKTGKPETIGKQALIDVTKRRLELREGKDEVVINVV